MVEIKSALELLGVDASDFNGHSFRIGAAFTAAANGMEDSLTDYTRGSSALIKFRRRS